jgi:DNA-binding IclR family transcriptional regulator
MIQYDSGAREYILGVRIWEFAMAYSNHFSVPQIAQPFLEQLRDRCDETVQMAILDGADVVYLAKMTSNRPVTISITSRKPVTRICDRNRKSFVGLFVLTTNFESLS